MIYYVVNRGATTHVVSVRGIEKIQMALTEGLIMIFQKLGRPPADINSPTFWLMMDNIIQVWNKVFPFERDEFIETVKFQREVERSVSESVKKGFSNNYAIPANMYKMIKTFFPYLYFTDKKFIEKFISRYPFLKTTKNKK